MEKQLQVFLFSLGFLMVAFGINAQAQTGGQIHITDYPDFDTKYFEPNVTLFNAGTDEDLVQATFCSDQTVVLDATEFGTGAVYGSYKWFLVDETTGVGTDLNVDAQILNYTSLEPGYHLFRVEGYSETNFQGCYKVTEIAVYVLPEIVLTEPGDIYEYCETDAPPTVAGDPANSFGQGVITLNADTIDSSTLPDTYEYRYQWYKTNAAGTQYPITGATSSTYDVGSMDTHTNLGVWNYNVAISYEVNDGGCQEDFLMATITVTAAPEKPVIEISGGHLRP